MKVTKKQAEAMKLVDEFIKKYDTSPSYAYVADKLGISKTAAHSRLKHYRTTAMKYKKKYNKECRASDKVVNDACVIADFECSSCRYWY